MEPRCPRKHAVIADQRNVIANSRRSDPEIVRVDLLSEGVPQVEAGETQFGTCPREVIVAGRDNGVGNTLFKLPEPGITPSVLAGPEVEFGHSLNCDNKTMPYQQRGVALSEW